jgi:hypothetical protein
MAAIQWDLTSWEQEQKYRPRPADRAPLRLVTSPPSRRRPAPSVYRRRQLVALVLVAALVLAVGSALARWATASEAAGVAPQAPVVLVAEPGDSYWSLAGELGTEGDLRSVVDDLVDANGGRELKPGDRIVVSQ